MVIFPTQSITTHRDTKFSVMATSEPNKRKKHTGRLLLLIQFQVTQTALEPSVSHLTDPSVYQCDHKFDSSATAWKLLCMRELPEKGIAAIIDMLPFTGSSLLILRRDGHAVKEPLTEDNSDTLKKKINSDARENSISTELLP